MSSRAKYSLRLAFGLGLLAVLLTQVDLGGLLNQIATAQPLFLAAAAVAFGGDRLLMAYKWNLLLRARGILIPLATALRLYIVGNLVGLVTPGSVGLDVYRVAALAPLRRTHDVMATTMLERLIGLAALAVCVLAALPFSAAYIPIGPESRGWIAGGCVVGLAVILPALSPRVNRWAFDRFRPLSSGKIGATLRKLADAYNESAGDRATLALFALWTGAEFLVFVAVVFLSARALGVDLGFVFFMVIVPTILLSMRLPITLNGLGVTETAYVLVLRTMGYPEETGLALGLLVRAVQLFASHLPAAILMMACRGTVAAPTPDAG